MQQYGIVDESAAVINGETDEIHEFLRSIPEGLGAGAPLETPAPTPQPPPADGAPPASPAQGQPGPEPPGDPALRQILGVLQQGQQKLEHQLGYLTRKLSDLERRGQSVPDELREQIETISATLENQRLAEMTESEQLDYWRERAQAAQQQRAGGSSGSRGPGSAAAGSGALADPDELAAQVERDYPVYERRMQWVSDAYGLPWDQVQVQLRKIQINADPDGTLHWDEWEDTAARYLKAAAETIARRQAQADQEPTPARAAGRALGSGARPAGPAAPTMVDFNDPNVGVEDLLKEAGWFQPARRR